MEKMDIGDYHHSRKNTYCVCVECMCKIFGVVKLHLARVKENVLRYFFRCCFFSCHFSHSDGECEPYVLGKDLFY